jgi:tetratricopeptide (TPR) repeat protein
LFQWSLAFNGSPFQAKETGKALEAFLYFKNGLKLTGVENLLSIKDPKKIDASVITLWKESLNDKDSVWSMVQVSWNPHWTEIFGAGAELSVALQKSYINESVESLTELIKKTAVDSPERNILEWQLVLNLGLRGDASKAAQVLAHLIKTPNNPVGKDLMTLTAGRLLYQNGFLDAAITYYQKISKKSDYWFQAQEEMAWAYMRKGEPQNAMAITKTLTYSHFKGWVGIESYLLNSFTGLKVCDYPAVIDTMKAIKPQFSDHLVALEKLVNDPNQPEANTLLEMLGEGPIENSKLGKAAHSLPMNISKDEVLSLLVRRKKFLTKEAELSEQIFARSLTFGNLQGQFDSLKSQVNTRAQLTQGASLQRIQEMAKAELEDSKQVMQRLRIVEVEMIQQVDSAQKFLKNVGPSEAKLGSTGSNAKFAMNFSQDKEIWFDELSNFKVNVKKGCSKASGKE